MADEYVKYYHSLDMLNTSRVSNLPAPSANNDAVRLQDLNAAIEGLAFKDEVRAATTANINISAPGTAIDGVTLTSGDRILVKDQTTASENGIYIFNGDATPATRALDMDASAEFNGAVTNVTEGTTNANTTFRQTTVNPVVNTDAINWITFGTSAPPASTTTAGIIEIATQGEVDAGSAANLAVTPQTLAGSGFIKKKYSTLLGDGSTLVAIVSHNLNEDNVIVQLREVSTGDIIHAKVVYVSANTINVRFSVAPATNAVRVIVMG